MPARTRCLPRSLPPLPTRNPRLLGSHGRTSGDWCGCSYVDPPSPPGVIRDTELRVTYLLYFRPVVLSILACGVVYVPFPPKFPPFPHPVFHVAPSEVTSHPSSSVSCPASSSSFSCRSGSPSPLPFILNASVMTCLRVEVVPHFCRITCNLSCARYPYSCNDAVTTSFRYCTPKHVSWGVLSSSF